MEAFISAREGRSNRGSGGRALAYLLLLLLLAACRERGLLTGPMDDTYVGISARQPLGRQARTEFTCEVRVLADSPVRERGAIENAREGKPWRRGHGVVQFQPGELARDGGVILYQFRGYEDGTKLVSTADCVIPRTERAIRKMHAGFGVRGEELIHANRTPAGPRLGDTGCVESSCPLATLYVAACSWGGIWPNCYNRPQSNTALQCGAMDPACGGWGDAGGDDPWSWEGGGGSNPTAPEDTTKCPQEIPVLNDPQVQSALTDLWNRSNPNAAMKDRREQGGFLVNYGNGTSGIVPFPESWSSDPCGIKVPAEFTGPPGTLALVHTHPYSYHERLTSCPFQALPNGTKVPLFYNGDPSFDDDDTMAALRVRYPELIGIVIDKDHLVFYDGDPNHNQRIPRCGY